MRTGRNITTNLAASAALTLAIAATAGAQQREIFHWAGRVDQEVQITMSGRNLTTASIGPSEPGVRRSAIDSPLPRRDGQVTVQLANGRGNADVITQPSAQNGYTAVVRIRDPQGGAGDYRLNVYWQPIASGEVGPPYGRAIGHRRREMMNDANRLALTWSGDVDDNLEIRVSSTGVTYRTRAGKDPRGVQSSFGGLPVDADAVSVSQTEGRGSVVVVQQPTALNGYTAVLRVRDPQPGYGHYAFQLSWQ